VNCVTLLSFNVRYYALCLVGHPFWNVLVFSLQCFEMCLSSLCNVWNVAVFSLHCFKMFHCSLCSILKCGSVLFAVFWNVSVISLQYLKCGSVLFAVFWNVSLLFCSVLKCDSVLFAVFEMCQCSLCSVWNVSVFSVQCSSESLPLLMFKIKRHSNLRSRYTYENCSISWANVF